MYYGVGVLPMTASEAHTDAMMPGISSFVMTPSIANDNVLKTW